MTLIESSMHLIECHLGHMATKVRPVNHPSHKHKISYERFSLKDIIVFNDYTFISRLAR